MDPTQRPLINKDQLYNLTEKTITFLRLVAQLSSSLCIDIEILEHTLEWVRGISLPSIGPRDFVHHAFQK